MSNRTARRRKREERRREELSVLERAAQRLRRLVSLRQLAMLGIASGVIVGALFLIQLLGGSAESGRIIDPVTNERTAGKFTGASLGSLAPNFEAQDPDGNLVRLSDFQGKPVILNFWATWCTACRAEIPALQRVFEERRDEGLEVIGVDWGEGRSGAARSYMDDLDATYTVAIDPSGDIGDAYRVRGLPLTLAIDRDGVVREVVSGELTYRAFDRFAQLVLGEIEDVGDDLGPVGDVTTEEDTQG